MTAAVSFEVSSNPLTARSNGLDDIDGGPDAGRYSEDGN